MMNSSYEEFEFDLDYNNSEDDISEVLSHVGNLSFEERENEIYEDPGYAKGDNKLTTWSNIAPKTESEHNSINNIEKTVVDKETGLRAFIPTEGALYNTSFSSYEDWGSTNTGDDGGTVGGSSGGVRA
ncbi:hypothetical protein QE152_g13078 [Popillia japonica]|uniref:Uncharacterized protein n=1 Tax=Popillia japonica TaxID=7064 RepID=A0AAW1LFF2_POPJA